VIMSRGPDGIHALIKEGGGSLFVPSTICKHKRMPSVRTGPSLDTKSASVPILDFPASVTVSNKLRSYKLLSLRKILLQQPKWTKATLQQ
jgi:hypothetical protein